MIVASGLNVVNLTIEIWLSAFIAITLGCAGCNVVTCYLDRDIDLIMARTRNRPLPSRRIDPPEKALYFGILLIAISLALSWLRNFLSFISMLLGVFDNIVVYSLLLKRRNPINIVLGGISGGLPAFFGWVYVTNSIDLAPVLIAALVVLWIPNHIWSLAIRYKEDYERARVPMLPVVIEEKKAVRCIVSTSVLLVIFSAWLYFLNIFRIVYLVTVSLFGSVMLLMNFWLFFYPTKQKAWVVFKFSSPYLTMIFMAMIIDVLLIP